MTFDELCQIKIDDPDDTVFNNIKKNWDSISKPLDGLGDFESVICKIGAIRNTVNPCIDNKYILVFCADNGIVSEGVSQCDSNVTYSVAKLIGMGKSTINTLSRMTGSKVIGVDIGIASEEKIPGIADYKIAKGTKNFLTEPAMSESEALSAIEAGIRIVGKLKKEGAEIIATGEMGIGNTTTSTALLCALLGVDLETVTGRGAGLDDEGLKRKKEVIKKALKKYGYDGINSQDISVDNRKVVVNSDKMDALCKLSSLGGFDIAGLVGAYIGGAIYHVPIIIDGLISAVSAYIAEMLVPGTYKYMIPSHSGRERGIDCVLCKLNLRPFILGNMALGEGTGAVMLFPLLDMVLDFYKSATTFEEGGIDSYTRFEE